MIRYLGVEWGGGCDVSADCSGWLGWMVQRIGRKTSGVDLAQG